MTDPLEGLNEAQRRVVLHDRGPLLVLAGAGSGKTRALTHRIAHLIRDRGAAPDGICAVTFTNKAAGEMRERIAHLLGPQAYRVQAGTFHATCLRLLRSHGDRAGIPRSFVIYDDSDRRTVLKRLIRELEVGDDRFDPRALSIGLSGLKCRGVDPRDPDADLPGAAGAQKLHLLRQYQERLAEARALDFDDLLLAAVRLLRGDPELLGWLRSGPFQHLLVDEYQDTNAVQYELVRLLAGDGRCLTAVGDEDQSIYGWRGADLTHLQRFEQDFADTTIELLEQNYRSTGNILAAAHGVIAADTSRRSKRLWTDDGDGAKVRLHAARSDLAEATFVVDEILKAARTEDRTAGDFAVFYRTNAQSRALEDELRRWNLPYVVVGGTRFYDRAEIKDAISYLRAVLHPEDPVALRRIVNRPARGIGATTLKKVDALAVREGLPWGQALERAGQDPSIAKAPRGKVAAFSAWLAEVRASAAEARPRELLRRLLDESGYLEALEDDPSPEAESRHENLEELLGVAAEHEAREPEATARQFLDEISLVSDADSVDEEADRVSLMTLHTAKGLEFPVVFVVGLEEDLLPHGRAMELPAACAEERRLLYVGMTRARERLYLLHASERMLHGERRPSVPSRFLADLDPTVVESTGVSAAGPWTLGSSQRVTGFPVSRPRPRASRTRGAGREHEPDPKEAAPPPDDLDEGTDHSDTQAEIRRLQPDDDIRPGLVVFHATFGHGTVRGVQDHGPGRKVLVHFPRVGVKKLLVRLANLGVAD